MCSVLQYGQDSGYQRDYEHQGQAVHDMEMQTMQLLWQRNSDELSNEETRVVIQQMKRTAGNNPVQQP